MAETGSVSMTRQEFAAFAQKLEAWGQSLTNKEQDFLEGILARAASSTSEEVQGFEIVRRRDLADPKLASTPDWWVSLDGRFSSLLPFDDGSLAP